MCDPLRDLDGFGSSEQVCSAQIGVYTLVGLSGWGWWSLYQDIHIYPGHLFSGRMLFGSVVYSHMLVVPRRAEMRVHSTQHMREEREGTSMQCSLCRPRAVVGGVMYTT